MSQDSRWECGFLFKEKRSLKTSRIPTLINIHQDLSNESLNPTVSAIFLMALLIVAIAVAQD